MSSTSKSKHRRRRKKHSSSKKRCWGLHFLRFKRCQRQPGIGPWCPDCLWQGLALVVLAIGLAIILPNENWRKIVDPFTGGPTPTVVEIEVPNASNSPRAAANPASVEPEPDNLEHRFR